MTPEILYEDDHILMVNKPAGLVVHSDGKTDEETLVDWVLTQYPEMRHVGEPMQRDGILIERPGVVHRLDRETSGVMVLAKDQETFLFLKNQFQNREISKTYQAVLWGNIKNDTGTIDAPIGRSGKDFRQWSAMRGARGNLREAITDYKVLARFEEGGEKFVFVEAYPKTGRTHQLRVHFKYLGNPIICDGLYASSRPHVLGFDRLALHARSLTLHLPGGVQKTFEAPYPDDFQGLLAKLS